jgi:hypothetical protein
MPREAAKSLRPVAAACSAQRASSAAFSWRASSKACSQHRTGVKTESEMGHVCTHTSWPGRVSHVPEKPNIAFSTLPILAYASCLPFFEEFMHIENFCHLFPCMHPAFEQEGHQTWAVQTMCGLRLLCTC